MIDPAEAVAGDVAFEAVAAHQAVQGQVRANVSDEHQDDEGDADASIDLAFLSRIALDTLLSQNVSNGQVDLILIDRDEIAELNEQHMGHAGPTDVLSFPLDSPPTAEDPALVTVHLGDIVISPVVARAQASEHAGSEAAEFALLTIHGVLHILGHDHVELDETLTMQQLERELMTANGFEHPVKR